MANKKRACLIMEFKEWEPIYQQILLDFNFDENKDLEAASILADLLRKKGSELADLKPEMETIIKDKNVYIFGAGISLEEEVLRFKEEFEGKENIIIISADGATSALMKHDLVPDMIVSDLDGNMPDQIEANKKGAIMIIHAHGDNIPALKKWVPKINGNIIGTTQAKPDENKKIYNFGGFTDGDRSVFLAAHFSARRINLLAFNFTSIGEYSFKYESEVKLRKLTWANLLIGMIKKPPVSFLTDDID